MPLMDAIDRLKKHAEVDATGKSQSTTPIASGPTAGPAVNADKALTRAIPAAIVADGPTQVVVCSSILSVSPLLTIFRFRRNSIWWRADGLAQ